MEMVSVIDGFCSRVQMLLLDQQENRDVVCVMIDENLTCDGHGVIPIYVFYYRQEGRKQEKFWKVMNEGKCPKRVKLVIFFILKVRKQLFPNAGFTGMSFSGFGTVTVHIANCRNTT